MSCKHGVPDNVSCWVCRGDAIDIKEYAALAQRSEEQQILITKLEKVVDAARIVSSYVKNNEYPQPNSSEQGEFTLLLNNQDVAIRLLTRTTAIKNEDK